MPKELSSLLANEDSSNSFPGVVPKLVRFLEQDTNVEAAYLCTDVAVQISKLRDEVAYFCGYRNMQMLCLALGLSSTACTESVDLSKKLTIGQLQTLIEDAWDRGSNAHGKTQTGGIQNTRKHVGTAEAEALFLSLSLPCTGTAFKGKDAYRELLDSIEQYFSSSKSTDSRARGIMKTSRPPIFLQRPQHSVTIIGIERLKSGKRKLLVFDPAWRLFSDMNGDWTTDGAPSKWRGMLLLGLYRKSERYLKRFTAFETLTLDCG